MPDESPPPETAVLALLTTALLIVVVLHAPHGPPFAWDDHGQYLSHARAMAEGRPYGDIGFIYTWYNNRIGPIAEPPGLPFLVAPLLAISSDGVALARALIATTLGILMWQAWRFSAPTVGERGGIVVALLLLAALSTRHAIDGVLSDVPFAAAIWAVVLAADTDSHLSGRRMAAMAVAGTIAFSFRMAAMALIPALAIFALLRPRREWKGLALVGLAWVAATVLVLGTLSAGAALGTESLRDGGQILRDVWLNLHSVKDGVMGMFTYPFGANLADDAWHVIALGLAAVGGWDLVRQRPRRFAYVLAAVYLAMLLVIPARAGRYWWPLAPLQILAMVHGFRLLAARWRRAPVHAVGAVAATALLAMAGLRSVWEPAPPLFSRPEIVELARWIEGMPRADSVRVSFYSPRLLTWETRVPAMGGFTAPPDETVAELRAHSVDYLIIGSYGQMPAQDTSFRVAVSTRPEAFSIVRRFGPLSVYRVH
jgi:hypothetical protein